VNCAGIGRFYHSHEMPFADWQKIIGVNLTGTFLVCQADAAAAARRRRHHRQHRVERGLMSQPYSAAYCASKGGVVQLTRALADEYLERGIRVNCVAPAASRRRSRTRSGSCRRTSSSRSSRRSARRSAMRSRTRWRR
jgi:NAD(P)-dependent dehydrogenase (short-subunit alcohol dehydrogenase family)